MKALVPNWALSGRASLFDVGRNCWRVESAKRAAFLIDGAAYFNAFRETGERGRACYRHSRIRHPDLGGVALLAGIALGGMRMRRWLSDRTSVKDDSAQNSHSGGRH